MTNPTPLEIQHKPQEPTTTPVASAPYHDDEISLVDLWLTLWKHRKLVLAILILSLVSGLALAILKPKQYQYAATVEIGTTLVNTGNGLETRLIDTPDTALAKIQKSFIPAVIDTYATQHQLDPRKFKLEASVPEKSQLIEISGKGPVKETTAYKAMIADVIGKLVNNHERIMQAVRAKYQAQLAQAKIKLDTLTDPTNLKLKKLAVQQAIQGERNKIANTEAQIKFLKARSVRLDDTDKIIKSQIKQIQHTLKSNLAAQSKALTSPGDAATALTTLMVSNEVLQSQRRLADLQERLQVAQPNLRKQLQDQIASLGRQSLAEQQKIGALQDRLAKIAADNQRAVAAQKQNVLESNSRLDGLRETRALSAPYRSVGPVGIGRMAIVLALGLLGVVLAVVAAFVMESIGKADLRLREDVRN